MSKEIIKQWVSTNLKDSMKGTVLDTLIEYIKENSNWSVTILPTEVYTSYGEYIYGTETKVKLTYKIPIVLLISQITNPIRHRNPYYRHPDHSPDVFHIQELRDRIVVMLYSDCECRKYKGEIMPNGALKLSFTYEVSDRR